MNILLANLRWDHGISDSLEKMRHLHFPLGLALIAGEIIKHRKDAIFVVDNYVDTISEEEILKVIETKKIDCLLLSMYLGNYQYLYLKRFINKVSTAFPMLRIIVGGPLASTIASLLIENTVSLKEQLICVVGEGEETIIELLACIEDKRDMGKVNGICYKSLQVRNTPARFRLKDLDVCAPAAYSLFNMNKYVSYVKETNRCWEISTSRGCYGSCLYCKLVFGRIITRRSVDNVVKEMINFYMNYGVKKFNFVDDNFLNGKQQIVDFYNALKKCGIKFQWRFQGRADLFEPELACMLQEVGLYDVSFGLESGSAGILKEMNKNIKIHLVKKNLKALPNELMTHGSFIVGMPGESQETIDDTIAFVKDIGLQYASAGIVTLFPGTGIYEFAKSKGMISDEDAYCESLGPVYVKPYINLTHYSDEQLMKWAELINKSGRVQSKEM